MIEARQLSRQTYDVRLPPTHELRASGGDERIQIDLRRGVNKSGCRVIPDDRIAGFGSSTASTISQIGFTAADRLRSRLLDTINVSVASSHARKVDRLRLDICNACNLPSNIARNIIFAPSGTGVHAIASRLWSNAVGGRTLVVMVQRSETGSGVRPARKANVTAIVSPLRRHGLDREDADQIDVVEIPIRHADGRQRSSDAVDDEVESLLLRFGKGYQAVLLVLTDVSKTGLLAPSPQIAPALRERWPYTIGILVDARQLRLKSETLHAYLENQCLVAITGSKFPGGPAFSGALLVPNGLIDRFSYRHTDPAFQLISSRAERPNDWPGAESLISPPNYGLLLRLTATLEELGRFKTLADNSITDFVSEFGPIIAKRLESNPVFAPLKSSPLNRARLPEPESCDRLLTIFPFLLHHDKQAQKRTPFSSAETRRVCDALSSDLCQDTRFQRIDDPILGFCCQAGEPVQCGSRNETEKSALRLCLSAPSITQIVSGNGARVIDHGLTALDKIAFLA